MQRIGDKFNSKGYKVVYSPELGLNLNSLDDSVNIIQKKLEASSDRVILIGHSKGGIIAKKVAIMIPDRVSHLISINSPHGGVKKAKRYKIFHLNELGENLKSFKVDTSKVKFLNFYSNTSFAVIPIGL